MIKFLNKTTFLTSLIYAMASNAQSTENTTAGIEVPDSTRPIEVVVVTADRSLQLLSQTKASVGVLDQQILDTINHQHINQAIQRVSGAWVSRGNGQEHLTAIRSPVLTGAGGCGAFFMALDGISLRSPGFCNANQLFDANTEQAQRIEVLRGPSGTLYGANALHGVINIITPDLFTHRFSNVQVDVGANEFARGKLSFTHDVSDTQRVGIFANLSQDNGFQDESGYDQQKLSLIYQSDGHIWQNKTVINMANLNQETAGFVSGFEVYKDDTLRRQNPNPEAFRDAKSLFAYSEFSRADDTNTLTVTPYLRWNDMRFLQHFLPWKALEENTHVSLGAHVKFEKRYQELTLITGAEADVTSAELKETQANDFSAAVPQGDHYDYDVDALTLASYAQLTYQLNKLQIKAGARIERVEYDYDNLLSDGSACAANVDVCRFFRPSDQKVSFTALSPSLTIAYQLDENNGMYTKFNRGFRAPQATELFRLQNNQRVADLDNETIDAIELGWQYLNDNVSLRTSLFSQTKRGVIFQDSDRQNISGGETSHQGIEIDYIQRLSPSLTVSGNYSYAEHQYQSDFSFSRVSIKNNLLDTAPRTLAGLQLNWQILPTLDADVSISRTSQYYLNPENTARYEGHTLLDLSLVYQLSPQLRLKANVYNLLDEDYAERADFGFGSYRYFVGEPRRLFFSVKWDWSKV